MENEDYKFEAHHFVKRGTIPWQRCIKCGLVGLNNSFTRWSVDKGCNSRYHPSYKTTRLKFTKLGR